jgi:DNA-binding phage protein
MVSEGDVMRLIAQASGISRASVYRTLEAEARPNDD